MVSISIVTYKTDLAELRKCLASLMSETIGKIYIIDNSREDYLKEFCKEYSIAQYIASENIGYGAAHNIAIKASIAAGSQYHLVLNSDVYFEPNVIEKLIEYMENPKNRDVAMVQPNIIYPNGRLQYTCRLLPTPANLIFRRFFPKRLFVRMNNRYMLKFNDHKKEMNVPNHQGSFMFFRISCFGKVGLFDERFFMYAEDIDITRRVHKYFRTMFYPNVTIVHAHRAASYKNKKMLKIHIRNVIKYFNKWGWLFDKERSSWNKELLDELEYNKKTVSAKKACSDQWLQ